MRGQVKGKSPRAGKQNPEQRQILGYQAMPCVLWNSEHASRPLEPTTQHPGGFFIVGLGEDAEQFRILELISRVKQIPFTKQCDAYVFLHCKLIYIQWVTEPSLQLSVPLHKVIGWSSRPSSCLRGKKVLFLPNFTLSTLSPMWHVIHSGPCRWSFFYQSRYGSYKHGFNLSCSCLKFSL